jgi:hypothetical protein
MVGGVDWKKGGIRTKKSTASTPGGGHLLLVFVRGAESTGGFSSSHSEAGLFILYLDCIAGQALSIKYSIGFVCVKPGEPHEVTT